MQATGMIDADTIRTMFSRAMSDMYRSEVPQYGDLLELVARTNNRVLEADPAMAASLRRTEDVERLGLERHGAIRLGTAEELSTIARLFRVMGMQAVGYYDLTVAGVPVHSTAFRPVNAAALGRNPFRVFTSLLRLELIEDEALRRQAGAILSRRRIFTAELLRLLDEHDAAGGFDGEQARRFVSEALETFRWHSSSTVSAAEYRQMHDAHRLIADIVCFRGPHINHLTPRTLDIDEVQAAMPSRGITPKETIEGPPRRACPILLRQTSFKALEEPILFAGSGDGAEAGTHTARFGEIEQRGVALTSAGRGLYDRLLGQAQATARGRPAGEYARILADAFAEFPDDHVELRRRGLAFYRYAAARDRTTLPAGADVEGLLAAGDLTCDPIVYEDFLPVSAAGIFRSNLGSGAASEYIAAGANQRQFEAALGAAVLDPDRLYQELEGASLRRARAALGNDAAAGAGPLNQAAE